MLSNRDYYNLLNLSIIAMRSERELYIFITNHNEVYDIYETCVKKYSPFILYTPFLNTI